MRCEPDRFGPLLDGELASDESRALLAHAASCPECGRHWDALQTLHGRLAPLREPMPRPLMQRVRAGLAVEASAAPAAPSDRVTAAPRSRIRGVSLAPYLRQAAALLIACLVGVAATMWWMRGTDLQEAVARDVLTAHVRALLQDNMVQVASTDSHTVKPWFAGRLEFTPPVKDLTADGFQLIGARLDYVGGQRIAALVYRRRLHQVTVFVWPTRAEAPTRVRMSGYNLVSWSRAGMTFWAISDLNEAELRELETLL